MKKSPNLEVTPNIMDDAINSLLKTENYTVNYEAVAESVRFMYTHWPNPVSSKMSFFGPLFVKLIIVLRPICFAEKRHNATQNVRECKI